MLFVVVYVSFYDADDRLDGSRKQLKTENIRRHHSHRPLIVTSNYSVELLVFSSEAARLLLRLLMLHPRSKATTNTGEQRTKEERAERPATRQKSKKQVADKASKRDPSSECKIITQTLINYSYKEMSSAGNPSSAASPTWANTSGPLRPSVEDHTGGGTGMDELLQPVSTLDEPVKETIMRDVRAVGAKLRAVLIPLDRTVSSAQLSTDKYASVSLY